MTQLSLSSSVINYTINRQPSEIGGVLKFCQCWWYVKNKLFIKWSILIKKFRF